MTPRRGALARGRLPLAEAKFIENILSGDVSVAKKHALQRLCGLLRKGLRLSNPKTLKGLILLNLQDKDAKVRRWAFNALAIIGDRRDVPFIETAWKQNFDVPDVFQAGLTSLAHILPKNELLDLLGRAGVVISPNVIMALAQETDQFDEEVSGVCLDPQKASARELRTATLLVGLEKAPRGLFSPRHPVESVLGELNKHDDEIVSQYSFWATVEHPDLSLSDVNVPPQLFSQLPPNVQAWSYRVLTKTPAVARKNNDFIFEGSKSPHSDVRQGVAFGLRDIFYDSLDVTVIDWLLEEQELSIREKLLEHMAAQADHSGGYREEVERAYRDSGRDSSLRQRIEAACENTGLSMTLRKIALQTGDPDLYTLIAGGIVNNTQNFNSQVNAGGISNAGTGNSGTVSIVAQQNALSEMQSSLGELLKRLEESEQSPEVLELRGEVEAALVEPKKAVLQSISEKLKLASEGATSLTTLGQFGMAAYDKIQAFIPYLS